MDKRKWKRKVHAWKSETILEYVCRKNAFVFATHVRGKHFISTKFIWCLRLEVSKVKLALKNKKLFKKRKYFN